MKIVVFVNPTTNQLNAVTGRIDNDLTWSLLRTTPLTPLYHNLNDRQYCDRKYCDNLMRKK